VALATPTLTLVVTATKWDVRVTVKVEMAGVTRNAVAGEVEVQLLDIGEGLDYKTYNSTPYMDTDANGQARFNNASYPWLVGFDGFWGANRFQVNARLKSDPSVLTYKYMLLGRTGWSDPDGQEDLTRYAEDYIEKVWR